MKKSLKNKIDIFAKKLGFSLVGYTKAKTPSRNIRKFSEWIALNYNADMKYMEKIQERKDTNLILQNAQTVILLATNYYYPPLPLKKGFAKIARYAYGRDYHKIIKKRLIRLQNYLHALLPEAKTVSYVDTGHVLERAFFAKAGLGFIGKNSCLITKDYGSWVFLSEIITDIPYISEKTPPKVSKNFEVCGGCRLCMDACPTGAIVAPGVIDARKCLAYQTIENKGSLPKKFHNSLKEHKTFFGCDICQEVCPHNTRAQKRQDRELKKKIAGSQVNIREIFNMRNEKEFLERFAGSPLMRAKLKKMKKVAKILLS